MSFEPQSQSLDLDKKKMIGHTLKTVGPLTLSVNEPFGTQFFLLYHALLKYF